MASAMESYNEPEDYSAGETARSIIKFLSSTLVGVTLYFLSGLAFTATLITLIVVTPAAVLFSPILFPAGMFVLLVGAGFVSSTVGVVWALSLLLKYVPHNKNWMEILFDLGSSLVKKYLKMRFRWIIWLWSFLEWLI